MGILWAHMGAIGCIVLKTRANQLSTEPSWLLIRFSTDCSIIYTSHLLKPWKHDYENSIRDWFIAWVLYTRLCIQWLQTCPSEEDWSSLLISCPCLSKLTVCSWARETCGQQQWDLSEGSKERKASWRWFCVLRGGGNRPPVPSVSEHQLETNTSPHHCYHCA